MLEKQILRDCLLAFSPQMISLYFLKYWNILSAGGFCRSLALQQEEEGGRKGLNVSEAVIV